jgi:hypothetical protein
MATVTKYKLNGDEITPYRNAEDITVSADFGTESQPSLDIESISLVDSAAGLNSQKLRNFWSNNPAEGVPFSIQITGGTNAFDFDFFCDYAKMKFLSDVETEIGLIKDNSLTQFDDRAQAITQTLLYQKNFLTSGDYTPVPYMVQNRKTLLERIILFVKLFGIVKSIYDEVHKLTNIAEDIISFGIIIALVNLINTIINLGLLIAQLVTTLIQIQRAFFPPVRYHAGLKPKKFIEKAVLYMGYDGVEFGNHVPVNSQTGMGFGDIMRELTWLGSKNNEKGVLQASLLLFGGGLTHQRSGLMKPGDFGYFLSDCIALLTDQFRLRRAIINNKLHLRPESDPFWITQSGYQMPDIKIEQIFAQNGTVRPNYDELNSSLIVEYSTDDSDLWTLEDLKDSADENSTGKIISVKTVEPINVNDERKNILKGSKLVTIPHCLANRKDIVDDLLNFFFSISDKYNSLKETINDTIDEFQDSLNGQGPVNLLEFIVTVGNRTGSCKIENDYFSVPKQMLLQDGAFDLPTIPYDFADTIGAEALVREWHNWDSFVPGVRDPNNPNYTAAKYVYEDVKIPLGLDDFVTILNNAYFTTSNGQIGKFTKLDWNIRGDYAIASYWIYNNWVSNIEENIT